MNYPSYSQLHLILNNAPDAKLNKFVNKQEFTFCILSHLKEYFSQLNCQFKILEPLFDTPFREDQSTTLSLDGVEVGVLHFTNDSDFNGSSLTYYSPSELIESLVFDSLDYEELKISDYILLVHEFSFILKGMHFLYKKS